jgi:hypothetical protein
MSNPTEPGDQRRNTTAVYLDPDDRIGSIRSKLEKAQGDAVVVVARRGVSLLRNPLVLKYLRSYYDHAGKEVLVVTRDRVAAALAREAGFRVFSSLGKIDRSASEGAQPSWIGAKGIVLAGSLLGLVGLISVSAFFLIPSATIILKPTSWVVSDTLSVTANMKAEAADYVSGHIPARTVESLVEAVDRTDATGKKYEPEKPASGRITFLNRSGERIVVPKGTRVGTITGVQFATKSEVVLPPIVQSTVQVEVEATGSGTLGNVVKLTINQVWGDLALKLSVLNEEPTSGGSDKEVKFVTVEDQDRLRKKMIEMARKEGLIQFSDAKKSLEHIYSETVRASLVEERFEQSVDQVSEWLEMRARASVTGLAFDLRDVNARVSRQLAGEERGDAELIGDSLKVELLDAYDWGDDWVSFHLFAQGKVTPVLDAPAIKRELAGMTREEAENYLAESLQLAEWPEVRLEPGWVKTLPRFSWRVNVQIVPVS